MTESAGHRGRFAALAGALALVALALWLTADQEVVAVESPHDDQFFMQRAAGAYWLDSGYTHMSFIKEPIYPLFAWLCWRLGVPLRLATESVYLAAAGFLCWVLVRRCSRPWVGLLLFASCALHPMRFAVFCHTTANALYPSLLLFALGALLAQVQRVSEPGWWRRGLLSGVALGLLWNARPERALAALLLLGFAAAGLVSAWRTRALRAWLAEWATPTAALAAITAAVMGANWVRFGAFAVTDLQAPGYASAYRALIAVEPERPLRFVPVTRDALRRAYAASPTFRELEPFFEGKLGAWWAYLSTEIVEMPKGEIGGGWFCWALRDAAALAGRCTTAEESEAFYRQVTAELEAAADAGKLATRAVPPFGIDPHAENYLPHLPASAAKLLARCWSREEPAAPQDHATDVRALFDAVANRRAVAPLAAQSAVRSWLWTLYGPLTNSSLLGGGLLAGLVLLRRGGGARRGWYFAAAAALALAALSRLGLFALIDASAFPADALRYLFPAALLLAVLAVWLLAEGAALLREPLTAGKNPAAL